MSYWDIIETKYETALQQNFWCRSYSAQIATMKTRDYLSSGESPWVAGKLILRQNAFARVKYECRQTPTMVSVSYPPYSCSAVLGHANASSDLIDQFMVSDYDVRDEAVRKVYSDIKKMQVDLGQAFAESGKAMNMVANRFNQLVRVARAVKKGRNPFKGNASLRTGTLSLNSRESKISQFANNWLEVRYGWIPMCSDIYNGILECNPQPPPFKVRRTANGRKEVVTTEATFALTDNYSVARGPVNVRIDNKTVITAYINLVNPQAAYLAEFGLENPARLAWDLLPYSFVLDWAFPIGTWLDMQTALCGLSVSSASVKNTTNVVYHGRAKVEQRGDMNYSVFTRELGTYSGRGHKIERNLGLPSYPFPKFRNPLSHQPAQRIIDSMSMLNQIFARSSR